MNIIPVAYFTDESRLLENNLDYAPTYYTPYRDTNGTPLPIISGCTNPNATNYNSRATVDDGSCELVSYPVALVGDSALIVQINSFPREATIIVDGVRSGNITPKVISYDYRQLLNGKKIQVEKSEFVSETSYVIKSSFTRETRAQIARVIYTITKTVGNVTTIQSIESVGSQNFLSLDFPLNANNIPVNSPKSDVRVYTVKFESNLSSDGIIRYATSDAQSGFLKNNVDPTITINHRLFGEDAWIKLERVGITNLTHDVKYTITNPNSTKSNTYTDDLTKVLSVGTSTIVVDVNKNVKTIPTTTPNVVVDNDNLEYNIASNGSIDIPYRTEFADRISYSIGKLVRDGQAQGKITLNKSDFSNGLGQYTLVLQAISNQNGSGIVKRVNINVVSKQYLPGPDITKINYPYNIKGADFKGYDVDFKISWQSVNTNYVEVYVTKKSNGFSLAKVASAGALTLNVADVLSKAKQTFNDSTDVLTFDLVMIPYNTEGNSVVAGKEERITIVFDKSDIKLKRAQVLQDIRAAFELNFNEAIFKDQTSRFLTHLAHFGGGDNKLISTWGIDTETFSKYVTDPETSQRRRIEFNPALVLKLYEPLPTSVQPNQLLWISKGQSLPIIEQIVLTDDEVESCIDLKPNFGLDISDDIGYQILDDLVASGSTTSTQLIQQYIGDNEFSLAKLDLDFVSGSMYSWENFVKYSSAEERVENFVYKVQLIEFYSSSLANLNEVTASIISVNNEVDRTTEKITNVKRGFDAFENYLYTQSGSLTYPGAGLNEVSSSNDSSVTNWYNGIISSAQSFDTNNKDNLTNNIPTHFVSDNNGQDFVLFFNMIGQHFDVLWSYIKKFSKSKQLGHTNQDGITDELVYHMLESLGWDADMGVKSQVLWEYAFGKNRDGSESSSMTGKERQQEIWRRLLNNLPYIYKHKGTKRALHAAMACYGVPTSMLTIMEFGGPTDPTQSGTTKFTFDDRTSAINFDGTANILVPWNNTDTGNYPQALEFRINTELSQTHTIAYGERWKLSIIPNTGSLAVVQFEITGGTPGVAVSASTTPLPLFNDVYTQIIINRSLIGSEQVYDLYVKEGLNERIRNQGFSSVSFPTASSQWSAGNEITIGKGFVGTMDEFRLWKTPLSESRIDNHTLLPDAIDGNHVSSSTEDLMFRMDFEYPKDRSSGGDTEIRNVSINQTYGGGSGSAVGFSSSPSYPYQYTPYERTVTANVPSSGIFVSNKIRFESRTLDNYLNFGSISNISTFDAADDSNKLGLFFSPSGQINMDIVRSLGQFNIDNYIGNPADEYRDNYSELKQLRNYYFQRYNLNIYEYIQLVRYIDQTLFTTLKSLVPGRANVSHGLLIEPHILERSKVNRKPARAESIGLETTIGVNESLILDSENIYQETTILANDEILLVGENTQWDGTVNASTEIVLESTTPFYDGTIVASENETLSGEYRTWVGNIDAGRETSLQGEYNSNQLQTIGMDVDSITVAGFGIYAENGFTIRTYIDVFGNRIQKRQKVYQIKEQYTISTPENINSLDPSLGTELVNETYNRYKITFLNYEQNAPTVSGKIVEVIPLNGYLPSHYRRVGDLTTGLRNSYWNGAKQTSETTLDGSSPVQTFTTNPNTLKVTDTGRGSGEPILTVD
jgi:hypothetical protein